MSLDEDALILNGRSEGGAVEASDDGGILDGSGAGNRVAIAKRKADYRAANWDRVAEQEAAYCAANRDKIAKRDAATP